jgi:hypothetical protein
METGLVCFLTALLLRFADGNRPVRTGLLCLAAFLARPEFLLFPLAFVVAWGQSRNRKSSSIAAFVAACVVLFGLWFVLSKVYFGRFMPMTSIKSVGWIDLPSTLRIGQILVGTIPGILILGIVLALGRWIWRQPWQEGGVAERAFLVFGIGLILFYLVTGTNLISRYLLVLYVPLAVFSATQISCRWVSEGYVRWQAWVLVLILLIVECGAFRQLHAEHIDAFVGGFQRVYTEMGHCLIRTSADDTSEVMVADVGLVGYYSDRRIIDLAGLTSTHVYDAGTHDDSTLIDRYRPRFVIIREAESGHHQYAELLARIAGSTEGIRVLYAADIAPLGVMADPSSRWKVVLFEVRYGGGEPAPLSGGRKSGADSSQRQAK